MTEIQFRRAKLAYRVLLVVTIVGSVSAAVVLGGGFVLGAFDLPGVALPIVTATLFALIFACQMLRWRLRAAAGNDAGPGDYV